MKKVIIISKKSVVTKSLAAVCKKHKVSCDIVENGLDGLNAIFENKYDLIVCSLNVEGVDGVRLIKTLKSSDTLNSITPTILITTDKKVENFFNEKNRPTEIFLKESKIVDRFENFVKDLLVSNFEGVKVKLLYIDDDPFIQKMVKLWLGKMDDIELSISGSVEETKGLLNQEFDIIASDNILGDGSFKDIYELVSNSINKDIPIIVYTGTVAKINVEETKKMGNVIDILPKPFEMADFLKKIEAIKLLKVDN